MLLLPSAVAMMRCRTRVVDLQHTVICSSACAVGCTVGDEPRRWHVWRGRRSLAGTAVKLRPIALLLTLELELISDAQLLKTSAT